MLTLVWPTSPSAAVPICVFGALGAGEFSAGTARSASLSLSLALSASLSLSLAAPRSCSANRTCCCSTSPQTTATWPASASWRAPWPPTGVYSVVVSHDECFPQEIGVDRHLSLTGGILTAP
ncbi:hypothetical protein Adu01nite_57330 [Paractinoplanes durhamensis]|uniref:Secreted protein n=1 Tax=Paractinoplanes durhamensis TaxID=113563 RepID=A0ABQ3Z3I2_9ACTN|nr:hypothetical protein Adu01nite_57330 [Actinoplanes durhamensis]